MLVTFFEQGLDALGHRFQTEYFAAQALVFRTAVSVGADLCSDGAELVECAVEIVQILLPPQVVLCKEAEIGGRLAGFPAQALRGFLSLAGFLLLLCFQFLYLPAGFRQQGFEDQQFATGAGGQCFSAGEPETVAA